MPTPPGSDSPNVNAEAAVTSDPDGESGTSGVSDADPDRLGQLLDLVTYAAATTAVFSLLSGVLAVVAGAAFVPGVKYGLFVFGWLAFGYGTFVLLPSRPWRDEDSGSPFGTTGDSLESGFQRVVQRLPPARFRPVPPGNRLSTGVRIFVSALAMMAVSIVLEQAFGVGDVVV